MGSALIGKRKLGSLEWALTGFLGGALGDRLTGDIWVRPDASFYFTPGEMIGLLLAIVASTGLTAGVTAWWVNRLAGGEAPAAPITGRWFVAHIFSVLPIAVLVAWPLWMTARIF